METVEFDLQHPDGSKIDFYLTIRDDGKIRDMTIGPLYLTLVVKWNSKLVDVYCEASGPGVINTISLEEGLKDMEKFLLVWRDGFEWEDEPYDEENQYCCGEDDGYYNA